MKKVLKKIISLLFAVIMIVGSISGSVAVEASKLSVGSIIEFGSYPQNEVTDRQLLSELNSQKLNWVSYGYFYGDGTNAPGVDECFKKVAYYSWSDTNIVIEGDYMQYSDIVYSGQKYRAVKFTEYRPSTTGGRFDDEYSSQSENGYKKDTVYWFEFEPVEWRVLDPNTGLLMCETVIDFQAYCNKLYFNPESICFYGDSDFKYPAYDYEHSSIRKWLNSNFYNTAFDYFEKILIKTTTLDNEIIYYSESMFADSTEDKVFLLSINDALNTDYGFSEEFYSGGDANRCAVPTDYAKCQGTYTYECEYEKFSHGSELSPWLLRFSDYVGSMGCDETLGEIQYRENELMGIRPALCVDLRGISTDAVHEKRTYTITYVDIEETRETEIQTTSAWHYEYFDVFDDEYLSETHEETTEDEPLTDSAEKEAPDGKRKMLKQISVISVIVAFVAAILMFWLKRQ